ncbi:MAG: DUF4294 domain-containing protein [Bacteroidaceae bacterium]|nr:DUF4294 domain-containing protein [Bacteroidaceae bacterium]
MLPMLTRAQEQEVSTTPQPRMLEGSEVLKLGDGVRLQFYRYKDPVLYQGELIWSYLMPELPVYPPIRFKNEKQRAKYNKLIQNVKRTLPIAQRVRSIIGETYEILELLPDEKSKSSHISAVEKSIKEQFTPEMKKLTYSQGKLLIKLVDRECNQSSYEIVKAFFGPTKAAFYQMFAWTFRSSLKKEYRPDDDDKMVERVVRQIEAGQL